MVASGGSRYISGKPGTGKTATLTNILTELCTARDKAKTSVRMVEVNCMTATQPKAIYGRILAELVSALVPMRLTWHSPVS